VKVDERVKEVEVEINYKPVKQFEAIHADSSKIILVYGGWRSGKSVFGVMEAFFMCLENPGIRGFLCRQTYRELEDTTKRIWIERIPSQLYRLKKHDNIALFVNGSEVLFRSLDKEPKILAEVGFFVIDQAEETEESMFNVLYSRLSQKGMPAKGILLCNPAHNNHWLYKRFIKNKVEGASVYQVTTYNNRDNLPKGYIEDLEKNYPADWVERYLKGNWSFIASGRRLYPEFSKGLHVKPIQYIVGQPIYRGWDFGYYHPACIWVQIDEDNRLNILYSCMGENVFLNKFVDRVLFESNKRFPGVSEYYDFCDPAGNMKSDKDKRNSIEILREKGIYARFRYVIVKKGIEMLNKKMTTITQGKPEFIVDPSNSILIEGFEGGYKYRGDTDEPFKDGYYEHLQDGLRYIVNNMFIGIPSIKIKAGTSYQGANQSVQLNPSWQHGLKRNGERKYNLWTGY